ncbi:F-box associated domain type 1 [Arabidopsis thaliana x Arabidopsis arenosa]|uniref:F-box associated domain type 1 n=1 Tax=Arabidopsis thaliana x Arabidopsis arenosa TaxID=1240361 RepID=A0A8T2AUN9_9BRAS|nr:F-box associated domain type 1 [Arabidopsis thaliana x Arabidopsis arenosa]
MSNSWGNIDVAPHGHTLSYAPTVSLKGNTYFVAIGSKIGEEVMGIKYCLLCFDFTSEKFGPHLPLPSHGDRVAISSVREEQLAVLYEPRDTSKMEIWVTTKIEPNAVSWSYFLKVDVTDFKFHAMVRSFFIDQEKTLAVFFMDDYKNMFTSKCIAAFIGENGYLRKVYLGQALKLKDGPYAHPLVYSYVPSLVQP